MLRLFGGGSSSNDAKKASGPSKLKNVKTRAGIDGILDSLKPTVFFYATEDSQIRALNALNGFIATKSKLEKALGAGMLDVVTDLVKLANDFSLLPVPHAKIMELVQTLTAIPSLKVKFGVEANLCNVLVGEIGEITQQVLESVHEATVRGREKKKEELLKAREGTCILRWFRNGGVRRFCVCVCVCVCVILLL